MNEKDTSVDLSSISYQYITGDLHLGAVTVTNIYRIKFIERKHNCPQEIHSILAGEDCRINIVYEVVFISSSMPYSSAVVEAP